jgi:hypothetical protein
MAGHCVLSLTDLTLIYQGSDGVKAAAAAVEGTHWTEAATISAAIFRCADEVGQVRRGLRTARTGTAAQTGHMSATGNLGTVHPRTAAQATSK